MTGQLMIVMAQVNLTVGDIDGNTQIVLDKTRQAIDKYQADLVAFPELTLTGYPPEDLLFRSSLQIRIDKALARIEAAALPCYLVIGHPQRTSAGLFNALSVIHHGKLVARYFKQYLPNYQVFDEQRYFTAGKECCIVQIMQQPVAFTVCEDLWEQGPIKQAEEAGARLLININASPYHLNKVAERRQLVERQASDHNMTIVYTNLVGGQDELVFDGGSMVVDATGRCRQMAPVFVEGLFPVQLEADRQGAWYLSHQGEIPENTLEANVYQALVLGVRDYVNKNQFKGVVLGLSGGIDSALTLAIAVDALGSDRVHAVMMPFDYTSDLSKNLAAQQASTLAVAYRIIPIAEIYAAFMQALEPEFKDLPVDVSEQNIQARCRGVLLMAISNKKGLMVLTTGNKSEIAVGYSTLYGDMAGGFDVLKDVAKTLVYRLSDYRNHCYSENSRDVIPQQVIDRPPSAELAPDQVDQDTLPPYAELDRILELYVEQDHSANAIIAAGFDETVVRRVLRLVDLNEYKRRQSPIGVRLTKRGFGRDRRYPVTNAWPLGD